MRRLALAWLALSACGCAPDPTTRIAGTWVVDPDRWLAEPELADLPDRTRAALDVIARGQASAVRFTFAEGECRREVAGWSHMSQCRVHAVERGTVVLHGASTDGAVDTIRVTPAAGEARVAWGGRALPVRRIPPVEGPSGP